MAKIAPIKTPLTAEDFFARNLPHSPPEPEHGAVRLSCATCGCWMRPFALVRKDEPTTKLDLRIWLLRDWQVLPWGGGTFCPAHVPVLKNPFPVSDLERVPF